MGRQLPRPETGLTPAEQHLGDRLAALIDGELGDDARERVLSHLATCRSCKTEAEALRRVKTVFADTAPPPPSDGLLARLQGLPAGGPDGTTGTLGSDDRDDDLGRGPGGGLYRSPSTATSAAAPASSSSSPWVFDYLPGGRGSSALAPSRGFRIHEMERLSSRGRRFAFAAAGAVSLAALALGGAVGTSTAGSGPAVAKGDSGGAATSSVRTASSAASADRDRRRRGAAPRSAPAGAVSASASVAGATGLSGASVTADRDAVFQHGTPWAMPTAAAAVKNQPGTVYPLLRKALFAPPLMRPALPPVSYGAYQTDGYEGAPVNAASGRTPVQSAPAPTPVASAAPPRG